MNRELLQTYIDQELSFSQIAEKFNCSPGTVFYYIKKYKLKYHYNIRKSSKNKRKSKLPKQILTKISNFDWMFNQYVTLNKTTKQIAEELGIAQSFINIKINEHKIKPHKKGFAHVSKEFHEEIAKEKRKHIPKELFCSKYLHEQHHIKKHSTNYIGKLHNVSGSFVRKQLKYFGIEILRHYQSTPEIEICNFIKSLGVHNVSCNIRPFDDNNIELDLFLPDYNLAIEYHGLYYHSYNQKETKFEKLRHKTKTDLCNENQIKLLQIFEHEWQNKKDIWKSIISYHLGKSKTKIYARKCEIRRVNQPEAKKFLIENHLQGFCVSSINLGLYFEDQLVSLMTFGKNRYGKGDSYELLRFVSKSYMHIVGAAGKLLKYFENNYSPESIKTYADLRYSNGNLYNKLGFSYSHTSTPNYWYYDESSRIENRKILTRVQCQKHKLSALLENFDPNLTEYENMFNNGYRRFWDSGNLVFAKKIN